MDITNSDNFILEGQFTINHKSKPIYTVRVSLTGILYYETSSSSRHGTPNGVSSVADAGRVSGERISFDDAVGCDCMKGKKLSDTAAYLVVYAYPRKKKFTNGSCRRRDTLTMKFDHCSSYEENQEEALRWNVVITSLISGDRANSSEGMIYSNWLRLLAYCFLQGFI